MGNEILIKAVAIVLCCIAVGFITTGLWFNSTTIILIGLEIALLEYMVIETRRTMVEVTDRLYELYMEERDNRVTTTDRENDIKRLDALTKELRVELSTLKMRVDNITPTTINVPHVHIPNTVPYNPNQWQVYCNETKPNVENGKWTVNVPDTQTAEIKTSDIGEIMPTIGVEQTYYDTTGKLNVGSGEIAVSTPLQYKEEEIPTTDL